MTTKVGTINRETAEKILMERQISRNLYLPVYSPAKEVKSKVWGLECTTPGLRLGRFMPELIDIL